MSSSIPEKEVIKVNIIRLLEKAQRHPDLTPKLLRTKIEQKLKLQEGTLSSKKQYIKKIALAWWTNDAVSAPIKKEASDRDNKSTSNKTSTSSSSNDAEAGGNETSLAMKRLTKLANAAGKVPQVLKGFNALSEDEKVTTLRQRLRDAGLVFSDVPTAAEIDMIQKERDAKKDMEGIDESAVIEGSRKRATPASTASSSSPAEGAKVVKAKKIKISADDEEEEADL